MPPLPIANQKFPSAVCLLPFHSGSAQNIGTRAAPGTYKPLTLISGEPMDDEMNATVERARADLAARLGISAAEVAAESVERADFPDAALGAPVRGEMSAMMITPGWRIRLRAADRVFEYRAARGQLRLFNFDGANHRI